jgi:DNA-binding beta-propeller fold protein YncE
MNKYIRNLIRLVVASLAVSVLGVGSVAAQGVTFEKLTAATLAWDAVPSPDASVIYFTAMGEDGTPGVFSIPAAGGEPSIVASGAPLVMPFGIAISTDGQMLYVTNPWTAGSDGNAIYAVPTASGQATVVEGTQGTASQGIEVVNQNGADQIYYTGIDPSNGQATVYRIAVSGGEVALIAKGAPLIAPSGVAVAQDGTVYVLDRLASGNGLGAVLRIQGDSLDTIARDVRIGGQLAGLTLTLDESLLLISSLDTEAGTAQVLVIDLATMQTSIINEGISENTGAGGLHRAHHENIFAWADITPGPPIRVRPPSSAVYIVSG